MDGNQRRNAICGFTVPVFMTFRVPYIRAAEAAVEFLNRYSSFVHTDGYSIYHKLHPGITVVGCLVHRKHKISDTIKSLGNEEKKTTWCYKGLEYRDAIFHMEKHLKDLTPEEHYEKRLIKVKPIMDAFFSWLTETFPKTIPDLPAY